MKYQKQKEYEEVEVDIKISDWIYFDYYQDNIYTILHKIDCLINMENQCFLDHGYRYLWDVIESLGIPIKNPERFHFRLWTLENSEWIVYTTGILNDYETVRITFYCERPFNILW